MSLDLLSSGVSINVKKAVFPCQKCPMLTKAETKSQSMGSGLKALPSSNHTIGVGGIPVSHSATAWI